MLCLFLQFLRFEYKAFSHDVTAGILVSQKNEKAAMLVSQTSFKCMTGQAPEYLTSQFITREQVSERNNSE